MAPASPKTKAKPKAPSGPTRAEFDSLAESLNTLVSIVTKDIQDRQETVTAEPAKPETPLEKEVRKASPDQGERPVPPEWEEKAQEVLGDALDHCEVFYPKRGGTIFTVIIKSEASNAPTDYLDRMKVDRRSREIGNEGIEGVEQWCKLIAQNLKRPKPTSQSRD